MNQPITQCDCGELPPLDPADFVRAMVTSDAKLAQLVAEVLERPDSAEALDYVLSIKIGGPSCGCGADHWSCDFGDDDDPESLGCDACGAEAGEECRPMCIGQAAHDDELGESAGCSCCQARSLAGQAYHECARCGHLGKYHVTCNRPLPGTAHEFSEEPDAIYQHLTRAHCSCGWHSGGYSKIARVFFDRHVAETGSA